MTSLARTNGDLLAITVCNKGKLMYVEHYAESNNLQPVKTFKEYLYTIAKMGGYLWRSGDRPPGNEVVARGISKLNNKLDAIKSFVKKLIGIKDEILLKEYIKMLWNTLL